MTTADPPLAVVVKGWPRLSETFIAQELAALEQAGLRFDIWSLRHPTDRKTHPLHDRVHAGLHYLPEYLHDDPRRVLRSWRTARRLAGYRSAQRLYLRDLRRDRTRNRVRRFGQACVLAAELPAGTRGIYAHFLHTPASVARYAAVMRELPWAYSAHAKDIWTSPEWEIREKLRPGPGAAAWGATCTDLGARHLRKIGGPDADVDLVYHGLDLSRFPDPPDRAPRAPGAPLRMLSVGRLVEKKGFDRLLDAFARLPGTLDWRWTHIGGGTLSDNLQRQARQLGIADRIAWRGACDQPEVIAEMRAADLFVLPSRVASDGDRDGLPNVLMEAASQNLPILSTPVSSIPEFIESGIHGLLVDDDPKAVADAICHIDKDPADAESWAHAAAQRLRSEFSMRPGIQRLTMRLRDLVK